MATRLLTVKYSQRGQYHFDITIYPLHDQLETGVVILVDDVTQRVTERKYAGAAGQDVIHGRDGLGHGAGYEYSAAGHSQGPADACVRDLTDDHI